MILMIFSLTIIYEDINWSTNLFEKIPTFLLFKLSLVFIV